MSPGTGADEAGGGATSPSLHLLVLGANGPTGRRTVRQALERGHALKALTRHPDEFPIKDEQLDVVGGDAGDPTVIDAAVAGCDAVISVIGSAFTRKAMEVYSVSAGLVIAAMQRHGCRRFIAVTSSGVVPSAERPDLSAFGRAMHHLARGTFGRTVYDDMERMEEVVSASTLDWTIVRPPGLTDEPGRGYATAEHFIDGNYCARDNLATMLLDQIDDTRYLRRVAAVTTPGLRVRTLNTIRRELLKR